MPQKRARIIYSGAVHGVGFRFTAERIANSKGHNLSNWDGLDKIWCRDCGRKMELFARGNRSNLMATGKALTEDCHEPHSYWQDIEDHFNMTRLDIN